MKKAHLSIFLSKIKGFAKPIAKLEQYPLDSQSAADILWNAAMLNDIKNKKVADLGCGPGILGLGALLLGAKRCWFVDRSKAALETAKSNLAQLERATKLKLKERATFVQQDVELFTQEVDTVLQNPPFGTKEQAADRLFLIKAIQIAPIIYSIHKTATLDFIKRFVQKNSGQITNSFKIKIALRPTLPWHRRAIYRVETTCLRIKKR